MPGRNHRETLLLTIDQIGDRFADVGHETLVSALAQELNGSDASVSLTIYSHRLGLTLPRDQPVRFTDIRSGDVLRVVVADPPAAEPEDSSGTGEGDAGEPENPAEPGAELQMLSGGLTGISYPLQQGENSVGRVSDNDVVVVDAGVSRHHATLSIDAGTITVTDNGSTNGIRIDGLPIKKPTVLESGERFLLGSCWACIVVETAPEPSASEPDHLQEDGYQNSGAGDPEEEIARFEAMQRTIEFARPPRDEVRFPEQVITLPAAPTFGGRRRRPAKDQATVEEFHAALNTIVTQLEASRAAECQARLEEAPSISAAIDGALDRSLLWQRYASDIDGLDVRLGLATQPSRTKLVVPPGGDAELRSMLAELPERFRSVPDVPAVVNLRQVGSLVIQGTAEAVTGLARSLVGQLSTFHGPDQLGLAYKVGERSQHWDWLKWLPHVDVAGSRAGISAEDYAKRISELLNNGPARLGGPIRQRAVIVMIDDPSSLPPALFLRLVEEGPDVGVYTLLLAEDDVTYEGTLGAIVRVGVQTATLDTSAGGHVGGISVELADQAALDPAARAMTALRYAESLDWPAEPVETKPEAGDVVVGRFELAGAKPPRWEDDAPAEDPSLPAAVPYGATGELPTTESMPEPAVPQAPQLPGAPQTLAPQLSPQAPQGPNAPTMPQMPTRDDRVAASTSNGASPPTDPPPFQAEPPLLLSALPPATGDGRLVLGTVQVEGRPSPAVFAMNLPRDRSLGLLGEAGAGKSGVLQTIAASAVCLNVEPDQIPAIFYLDVPGELDMLKVLPNAVGAVRNDIDGFRAITTAIASQLSERRSSFIEVGASTLDDYRQRHPNGQLRRVLVLIDDLVAFRDLMEALDPGRFSALMGDLLGDGARLGIHVVFAAEKRVDVGDDLDPRVGRWLTLGGADPNGTVRPGRAVVGKNEVRFAVTAESAPEEAFSMLGKGLIANGATTLQRPTGTTSTSD